MGGSTRHLESDFQQNRDRSDWKAPWSATLRQGAWEATQEAKCWSCKPEDSFIGFSEPTLKSWVYWNALAIPEEADRLELASQPAWLDE